MYNNQTNFRQILDKFLNLEWQIDNVKEQIRRNELVFIVICLKFVVHRARTSVEGVGIMPTELA